ncbi:TniQ family protein [Thioclava sp.]|uniref:TniQ family protein n=1 Tax=Thioclava sp. TaxID=1933450 RepID=UPI003AA98E7F
MQLQPYLPFRVDETALSWATRLAAFHTGGRLVPFLNDLEISPQDLAAGDDATLERLCFKVGQDPRPVRHNAITRIAPRQYRLRGETFRAEFTTGVNTRFCPACLAEDDGGHARSAVARAHQLIWRLQPVRVCPRHELELVERRLGGWDDFLHELPVLVPETRDQLLSLAEQARSEKPTELQGYVLARLHGKRGPAWLDAQSIEQATRATEMLGATLAFGTEAKSADLDFQDWVSAARHGWPYVYAGEEGLRQAFSELQEAAKGKGRTWQSRGGVYGMLYRWLSANHAASDLGPIRSILREFIIDTTPMKIGQKLLGEYVAQPKISSVASIAKSSFLHPGTLKNVLQVAGAMPNTEDGKSDSGSIVKYREIEKLVEAAKHAVPVTQVPSLLNASRPMVAALLELKLLVRVQDHNVLKSKIGKAIDGRSIIHLLQRLNTKFEVVGSVPETHTPLAKAAEKTRAPIKVILELVFDGHLTSTVRLAEKEKFASLFVSPADITAILDCPPNGVSEAVRFSI